MNTDTLARTKCGSCEEFKPRIRRVLFFGKRVFLCQGCEPRECFWCKQPVLKRIMSFGEKACELCHEDLKVQYHEAVVARRAYA